MEVSPGLTIIEVVVAPVFHKYVLAPEAVSNDDVPVQNKLLPPITTTGSGLTITCMFFVAEQPLISVTVTVYKALETGLTLISAVVDPVFQT